MLRLVMEQKAKVSKVPIHGSDGLALAKYPSIIILLILTTFLTGQSGSLALHCEYKGSARGVVRRPCGPRLQLAEHGERAKGAGDEEDLGVLHLRLAGQHCWQPHDYQCHHCCQHHFGGLCTVCEGG